MVSQSWLPSDVDGRRIIVAIGGMYLLAAVGCPFTPLLEGWRVNDILVFSFLTGIPGLVLLYGGYRLPRTDIRPALFATVARWCLRSIGVILGVLFLVGLITNLRNPVINSVILTALTSVAGLGMGFNDAQAKTRALNAEEQRQEAERYSRKLERYETIVETVNDGIFVIDEDNRFTLVNEACADLVGYDREELLDSPTSLVVTKSRDDLADEIRHNLVTDGDGAKTNEAIVETASGEKIETEATVARLPKQEDAGHDLVGVVRDITERNEREQQLERQNKRLDSFASMVAHELRNPLMIGQMYCNELPPETAPVAVDYITESFDRIEDIIDVLLVVTQGYETAQEDTPVALADVAQNAWHKVNSPDATLEILIDHTISADETYIEHLFRNLFENAIEHGGADVTVTVGELSSGFYVADDGIGIPADDRETVFEMGYTTSSSHGGMGLGLAFIHELAKVYGWNCSLTESATGGAQFEFTNVADAPTIAE